MNYKICYCTLSCECHVIKEGQNICEICEYKDLIEPTAENVENIFRQYEIRCLEYKKENEKLRKMLNG